MNSHNTEMTHHSYDKNGFELDKQWSQDHRIQWDHFKILDTRTSWPEKFKRT
jgi:hypothetical protein